MRSKRRPMGALSAPDFVQSGRRSDEATATARRLEGRYSLGLVGDEPEVVAR